MSDIQRASRRPGRFWTIAAWFVLSLVAAAAVIMTPFGQKAAQYVYNQVRKQTPPRPLAEVLAPLDPRFRAALESMYAGQPQMGTDGSTHAIDKNIGISPEEGIWIYELCRRLRPQQTLEIGWAYGFSTVYFMAAIAANGVGTHVAIDPFETTYAHGIGLQKARELGMQASVRWVPDKSAFGLPALAKEGRKFEVIFIDGSHLYDDVLLDFRLSDYVCAKGGFIVFDDMWLPAIRKVASFVAGNRSDYRRYATPVANIAVFQKVGDDRRDWSYFVDF